MADQTTPQTAAASNRDGWSQRSRKYTYRIALWYGVFTSLYVLLRSTIGANWNIVAFVNNFIPWCAGGGLVLGTAALFSKHRWLVIGLQLPVVALFILLYGSQFQSHEPVQVPTAGHQVTVATYNVFSASSDVDRIIEVVRSLDADVVGLQELGFYHAETIEQILNEDYKYQALFPNEYDFGLGILSQYPLTEAEVLVTYENYRGDTHLGLMRAVVNIDENTKVIVYVAHPPVPSPVTYRDNGLRIYDDAPRDNQLATLRHRVRDEKQPVIVLCDCNSTDQSTGYRQLDRVLNDAFRQTGSGLGFTVAPQPMGIPALLPLIMRVDYVWYSDDFVAINTSVGSDDGTSDHRPVFAQLFLK